MKKTAITAMTLVLALCILFACGCTTSATPETTGQPTEPTIQPISYDDSPVQYSDVNNVTLAYREFGTENTELLLMIIGFGGAMEQWNSTFVGILAENYHVYVYDHRGMGKSTDVDAPFTVEQLSDDAADLITALGYDSMNIYGVSMGSTVSQQLLIDHPEKVRKAVLSSATYSANIPETEKLYGILEESSEDTDKPEAVRKEAVANLEWEGSYDSLSGITNDVMLITGTADDLTPQSVALEIANQIDGSWLVRYKGIPHAGSSYAPVEYGNVVTTFLEMDESPA
ncbi:alpha/beta fold hydrolase [Methanogenium sp. MK-MG]|uniref:alpha/beta fold hydrolase n=1 Tax=Methanogenium sp. MK-MG TaxID=2599926 RepID=UPI0013EDE81B|nr:alpha/beta hydrolase [Methanogenium sp. MK-MG]KAF1074931.1 putative aminoacrylate hydrolase RutD [Methanogenium sp. MK-MG]